MCGLYYHFNNLHFNNSLKLNDLPIPISSISLPGVRRRLPRARQLAGARPGARGRWRDAEGGLGVLEGAAGGPPTE